MSTGTRCPAKRLGSRGRQGPALEIAVASERHRTRMERRQRAEDERREGSETCNRLDRDLAAAAAECSELERLLTEAQNELTVRNAAETEAPRRYDRAR